MGHSTAVVYRYQDHPLSPRNDWFIKSVMSLRSAHPAETRLAPAVLRRGAARERGTSAPLAREVQGFYLATRAAMLQPFQNGSLTPRLGLRADPSAGRKTLVLQPVRQMSSRAVCQESCAKTSLKNLCRNHLACAPQTCHHCCQLANHIAGPRCNRGKLTGCRINNLRACHLGTFKRLLPSLRSGSSLKLHLSAHDARVRSVRWGVPSGLRSAHAEASTARLSASLQALRRVSSQPF
jgi:hypothetical protein